MTAVITFRCKCGEQITKNAFDNEVGGFHYQYYPDGWHKIKGRLRCHKCSKAISKVIDTIPKR